MLISPPLISPDPDTKLAAPPILPAPLSKDNDPDDVLVLVLALDPTDTVISPDTCAALPVRSAIDPLEPSVPAAASPDVSITTEPLDPVVL